MNRFRCLLIGLFLLLICALPTIADDLSLGGASVDTLSAGLDGATADVPVAHLINLVMSILPVAWRGYVLSFLTLIGTLRLIVKPALALAHRYAARTGRKTDDQFLARLEASPILQFLWFGLDVVASVKPYRGPAPTFAVPIQNQPEKKTPVPVAGAAAAAALATLVFISLLTGCSRFETRQFDRSYENGKLTREIETRAKAGTLIDSKSALANFKANQTDKNQQASVGSLTQEATSTNITSSFRDLVDLIKLLKGAPLPIP